MKSMKFPRSKSQDRTFAEALAENLNTEQLKRKSFYNSTSDLHDNEEIEHPFQIEQSDSMKHDEYDEFLLKIKQDSRSYKLLKTSLG